METHAPALVLYFAGAGAFRVQDTPPDGNPI